MQLCEPELSSACWIDQPENVKKGCWKPNLNIGLHFRKRGIYKQAKIFQIWPISERRHRHGAGGVPDNAGAWGRRIPDAATGLQARRSIEKSAIVRKMSRKCATILGFLV